MLIMKLTIEKTNLLPLLSRAKSVVAARTTVPVLGNLLFHAQDDRLHCVATDLDRTLNTSVQAAVSEPGSVTVPASSLTQIVSKLPNGCQIAVETTGDNRIAVKSGRSRFLLPTLPAEDFPNLEAGEFPFRMALNSAELAQCMGKTFFAVSTEETRYYLNGVFMHYRDDGKLVFVATDGHRLSRYVTDAPHNIETMPGIIIPRMAIDECMKLLPKEPAEIDIEISSSRIRLHVDNDTLFTSKLIDGSFPDYERVIPAANTITAIISREALMEAVARVETVAADKSKSVRLTFSEGNVLLENSQKMDGAASEELDIIYDHAPYEVGFSGSYLGNILSVLTGSEVTIKMGEYGSPAILTGDNGKLTTVLMPMRV